MQYEYTSADDRLCAMLAYLLGLFFPLVAPIVIFLVRRNSRYVAFHALQALFIELAVMVLGFAVSVVGTILGMLGPLALFMIPIGIGMGVVGIAAVVYKIVAAIKSFGGDWYRVPVVAGFAERSA